MSVLHDNKDSSRCKLLIQRCFTHKLGEDMKIKSAIIACCLISAVSSYTQAAGTISGQLDVRLTITQGCSISNGNAAGSYNQFGTLDFGIRTDITTQIDAQASGNGGNTILVICTPLLNYSVGVDSGAHASGIQRRMQNQTTGLGTNFINYNLYQDFARTTAWVAGTPLPQIGTGLGIPLNFYGRVPAVATPAPAAGTYTDAVLVSIVW